MSNSTKAKTLTATALADIMVIDNVSKKRDGSGHFIFRKGYFYTNGGSEDKLAERIERDCKINNLNVEIVDKGNHWAAFNGGAPLAKSSHWWVVAKITRM